MTHPLLDSELFRIRSEVLDVIFHSAPIQCTVTAIGKWNMSLGVGFHKSPFTGFFKIHDQLHGQEKRLKLRWRIEYFMGDSSEDKRIKKWAAAMGIPAENVETCDPPRGYGW